MAARPFFLKSSASGSGLPGMTADRCVGAIMRGEPGEGGELEQVVLEEFLAAKRPLLVGGGPLLAKLSPLDCEVSVAVNDGVSVMAKSRSWSRELLVRRNKLETVRLILLVEPRVVARPVTGVCDGGAGSEGRDVTAGRLGVRGGADVCVARTGTRFGAPAMVG